MTAVAALKDRFGIAAILRVLDVAASTYYGWLAQERDPSARRRDDAELLAEITEIHDHSGGTYGSPRVHAILRRRGRRVARKRVERLMRENGLQGAFLRKRWRVSSTRQDPRASPARTWSTGTSPRPHRIGCGWPMPPASPAGKGCSGSLRCAMCFPTASSDGGARTAATPTSSWAPWRTRSSPATSATGNLYIIPIVLELYKFPVLATVGRPRDLGVDGIGGRFLR